MTTRYPNLSKLLDISSRKSVPTVRVLPCCNWCSTDELIRLWAKMAKSSRNNRWGNIELVREEPCDYYCVINAPPKGLKLDHSSTILFRMEPRISENPEKWGEFWSNPSGLLYAGIHEATTTIPPYLNVAEWHLSKTYDQLSSETISKQFDTLSTVLSDKYSDPGHVKRVDFIKFVEKQMKVDVFGGNRFLWKDYKGVLDYHSKDNALFPYKYTFNCENHSIKNYCTEKLYDGIIAECLVFYNGCFNIRDHIDPRAYVYLELSNFEADFKIIKQAIQENWWEQRLPYIKEAKKRILNELQVYPRLESIITEIKK
jgi:hypothetical protein